MRASHRPFKLRKRCQLTVPNYAQPLNDGCSVSPARARHSPRCTQLDNAIPSKLLRRLEVGEIDAVRIVLTSQTAIARENRSTPT